MRSGSLDLHSPVKSSTRFRVSVVGGGGLKRAHEKGRVGKKNKKTLDRSVIDPFCDSEE